MAVWSCYFWDMQEASFLPEETGGVAAPASIAGESVDIEAPGQQGGGSLEPPQVSSPMPQPTQHRLWLQPLAGAASMVKAVMLLGLWELLLRPVVLWQPPQDDVALGSASASARAVAVAASAKKAAAAARKKTPAWASRPLAAESSGGFRSPAVLRNFSLAATSVAALLLIATVASYRINRGRRLFGGAGNGGGIRGLRMAAVPLVLKDLPAKASRIGSIVWQRLVPIAGITAPASPQPAVYTSTPEAVVAAPAPVSPSVPPVFAGAA